MVQVILLSVYNKEKCRILIPILGWEHVRKFPHRKEEECRRHLSTRNFGNTAEDEIAWWLGDPLLARVSK
jgi:hypothetical protein